MRSEQTDTLKAIAESIGGTCFGAADITVTALSIDSRSLLQASETVFFAIVGERHNGHDYINDLYQRGVRAFVVSDPKSIAIEKYKQAGFVQVENTLLALQKLAQKHRKKFSCPVIGITGSNGKTITKEWLYQLLNQNYSIVRSPKSYNSQVGVPLSVLAMNPEADLGIFEAGISCPGEMSRLVNIIQPNIGLFTHLGDSHRENFKGKQHILDEKIQLFATCKWIAFCSDQRLVYQSMRNQYGKEKKFLTWSRKKAASLQVIKETNIGNGTSIQAWYNQQKKEIQIPFTDKASVNNAILCWLCMLWLDIDDETINFRFQNLEAIAMRLEIKEGTGNCTIINDYYNSDLGSLEIALDVMAQQQTQKKKTLILSDILQSGYTNKKLYQTVAKLIRQKNVDQLIGIGENITSQTGLFPVNSIFYQSTSAFLDDLERNQFQDEIILIKGSRNFHFEQISHALQYKAHRTVLEVNLNAMVHNLNHFRSLLQPQTRLVAMVKAFSYGSGSAEIAKLLQYHRVDYLAVAIADEGVELRNSGINIPIMVMNPEAYSFDTIIEYRLEPEIYNLSILQDFEKALQRNGVKNYPIHLKLDTGMHRLGFVQDNTNKLISHISNNDLFYIRSIFSHLAGADEAQHDNYTRQQIEQFRIWSNKIRRHFPYPIDRHILNSAGIERFPEAQFEMVRLGIGLYGISVAHQEKLMNVSSLKTTISQIKEIAGEKTVGYARKGVLKKNTRIGVIPIGYADGFNRKLSNGLGKVLVNGKLCPIVGNICMDMSMIDLSEVKASEGDTVLVFGDEYPVSILAEQLGTIPYEILTTISRRVKRVYYQE